MTVTNKLNLPTALVQAVSTTPHNKDNCYSATTLLKGVREILLTKRHFDEITVDASENIWAIFGTAVHAILESKNSEEFKEERFEVPVYNSIVTGQVDNYNLEKGIISDYKTASVWKVQFNDFEDWRKQGLIYAWLMNKTGLPVKKCRFIALLKDHSKTKAKLDGSYPQKPVYVYEFAVEKKDLMEIELFITNKIKDLEFFDKVPDEALLPCTDDERWADGAKWACHKGTCKRASKLFDKEDEAKDYAVKNGMSVIYRPPVARKCADYCNACVWCNQYIATVENES